MLRYSFNLEAEAREIETAVERVLNDGYRTKEARIELEVNAVILQ